MNMNNKTIIYTMFTFKLETINPRNRLHELYISKPVDYVII